MKADQGRLGPFLTLPSVHDIPLSNGFNTLAGVNLNEEARWFTLIELILVIALIGVLGATALPCYRAMQAKAFGSEAIMMLKWVLDAEIIYFLEHDELFPQVG